LSPPPKKVSLFHSPLKIPKAGYGPEYYSDWLEKSRPSKTPILFWTCKSVSFVLFNSNSCCTEKFQREKGTFSWGHRKNLKVLEARGSALEDLQFFS